MQQNPKEEEEGMYSFPLSPAKKILEAAGKVPFKSQWPDFITIPCFGTQLTLEYHGGGMGVRGAHPPHSWPSIYASLISVPPYLWFHMLRFNQLWITRPAFTMENKSYPWVQTRVVQGSTAVTDKKTQNDRQGPISNPLLRSHKWG